MSNRPTKRLKVSKKSEDSESQFSFSILDVIAKQDKNCSLFQPPLEFRPKIGIDSLLADSEISISAQHFQEHADGDSYLSIKRPINTVTSLLEIGLSLSARYLLDQISTTNPVVYTVGWNMETGKNKHLQSLRETITQLPINLITRLLAEVLRLSNTLPSDMQVSGASTIAPVVFERELKISKTNSVSPRRDPAATILCPLHLRAVLSLAYLFFNDSLTTLDLSSFQSPPLLLNKLLNSTSLSQLDLSSNSNLTDSALAKLLTSLPSLSNLNVRRSVKIGDASISALAETANVRLKHANLSITNVSVKGLILLVGRCCNLETLKLANVAGLVNYIISSFPSPGYASQVF
jgi:hypothetical protein